MTYGKGTKKRYSMEIMQQSEYNKYQKIQRHSNHIIGLLKSNTCLRLLLEEINRKADNKRLFLDQGILYLLQELIRYCHKIFE